jgi:exopolyphosphatase/guanosine-5'-triphosphate,3'-diphosphate pyrophosphatase
MAGNNPGKSIWAALDVGSNTVLMLIAEISGSKVSPISELLKITRLGRGVDHAGRLDAGAVALTLETIGQFVERARALGAQKILAAGTAALRDARNGPEFIEEVRRRSGVELEIIPGHTEARLNFLAAVHGLGIDAGEPMLIVDIGGGSTELIRCEGAAPSAMVSLQIGSVRLTERFIRHDPPASGEQAQIYETVKEQLGGLGWKNFRPNRLIGVAGTVTTVAAVAAGLNSEDHSAVHGYQLSREQVGATARLFFSLTVEQRKQLPGMVAGRADVICSGAAILDCIARFFGAATVTVSNQGVRWGLVYRELEKRTGNHTP